MTKYWVICGSARGVGKTYLSSRLVAVLPRAIHAKLGHCSPKPSGEPNYFCSEQALAAFLDLHSAAADHFVIESNAWARAGRGNIVVLLDGREAGRPLRSDLAELRSHAHIHLGNESTRDWEQVLTRHLLSRPLCQAVLDLFVEQTNHLASHSEARLQ